MDHAGGMGDGRIGRPLTAGVYYQTSNIRCLMEYTMHCKQCQYFLSDYTNSSAFYVKVDEHVKKNRCQGGRIKIEGKLAQYVITNSQAIANLSHGLFNVDY